MQYTTENYIYFFDGRLFANVAIMNKHFLKTATLLFFLIFCRHLNAQKLSISPYACCTTGTDPVDIKHCGDDRLFVLDRSGIIQVVNANATIRPVPFLDISSKIYPGTDEESLVGMAFSPNYKTDGKFYVYYVGGVSGSPISIVEQYNVSAADSNIADASSALTIITQSEPFDIHKAGNMMFGKDGYLYINFGDGGSPDDSAGNAQNETTLNGKIVRIDVSNSSLAQPYVVPATNPFYNNVLGIRPEIWASGLRNPWRASIDRITGDRWLTDVGQNSQEEVDFETASFGGGNNYGWNIMEGTNCFNPMTGCNTTGLTLPTYTYPHPYGDAIMGGYVYRSAQSKSLFGTYIFADFIAKWFDGIKQTNGVITDTFHLITGAQNTIGNPLDFGEDRYGDLYVLFLTHKTIYKLVDTSYLRIPKAYMTPLDQGNGTYLLQGLPGRNLTYQWLRNNAVIPGATSPDYLASTPGIYSLVVTNTLNFSDTSDVFSFGVLPLNLISFTAQKISGNKIALQWQTASEQNISSYSILRKQNNDATFVSIGSVLSKSSNENAAGKLSYNFTDSTASRSGSVYYRLQIKNIDGSYTYSDVRLINNVHVKNNFSFYPNPAKGKLQVNLDEFTKPVVMILYNNIGQKIKEQFLSRQTTTVDIKGLKGLYIVQLSDKDGGNLVTKKLIVE